MDSGRIDNITHLYFTAIVGRPLEWKFTYIIFHLEFASFGDLRTFL